MKKGTGLESTPRTPRCPAPAGTAICPINPRLPRCKANRRPPVLTRLRDGSYLSRMGRLIVRIIEALVTITCALGIAALAGGVQGWLFKRTTWIERVMSIVAGLALVYPTLAADIVGLGLFAVVVAAQLIRIRAAREPVRAP